MWAREQVGDPVPSLPGMVREGLKTTVLLGDSEAFAEHSAGQTSVLLIKGRGPPCTEPGVVLPGRPPQRGTNSSSCLFRELNVFSFAAIIFILKNSSLTFNEAFPFER